MELVFLKLLGLISFVLLTLGGIGGILKLIEYFRREDGKDNLQNAIDALPSRILNSITGTTNNKKGNLGEMVGYLKLHADYDRLIPLGNIADFLCIRLPTDTDPGTVDFVDIKTGNAKLSKDQIQLRNLIKDKKVNFIKFTVEVSNPNEDIST